MVLYTACSCKTRFWGGLQEVLRRRSSAVREEERAEILRIHCRRADPAMEVKARHEIE